MATEVRRRGRGLSCALLLICLCGCSTAPGRLYSDWTTPFSRDFGATPRGSRSCEIDEHYIKEPFTSTSLSVDWTSDVIRRAMREAGMSRAYYADRRVISVLNGIYRRTTIVIHGD